MPSSLVQSPCLLPLPLKLEPELNDHVASTTEHIPDEDLA